jgi:hypothetical protein
MSAGEHDIYIEQGADFYMLMTLADSDGNRVDLTSHTFSGKIRRTPSTAGVDASFTFTVLDQTQDETKGQVEVELSAVTTAAIVVDESADAVRTITNFSYDIESINGGVVTRWLEGVAEVSPEVTK